MRVLIVATPTPSGTAEEFGRAVSGPWSEWAEEDDLTVLRLPHNGRGLLDSLEEHGFRRSGGLAVRDRTHVIDAESLLAGQSFFDGTTASLAPALIAALDAGTGTIVVGLAPATAHDGGRGLLGALASRWGSVEAARAAFTGTGLVLAISSGLPLLGLSGAGAALAPVVGPEAAHAREREIGDWAAAMEREHAPRDLVSGRPLRLSTAPGSGLAGGAGFALLLLGARSEFAADWVAGATGLDGAVRTSDLAVVVIPALDADTMDSSALTAVATRAAEEAVPVVALVGEEQVSRRARAGLGIAGVYETAGNTFDPDSVAQVAARVARTWSRPESRW
ncbi:MAG TPA: glycerate kinase [Actinomycetaceae bacterium]|nr:glycerate kinase [Actinomycetaceae bacterium]